jgi:hypothetical protein
MIAGCDDLTLVNYSDLEEVKKGISAFLKE